MPYFDPNGLARSNGFVEGLNNGRREGQEQGRRCVSASWQPAMPAPPTLIPASPRPIPRPGNCWTTCWAARQASFLRPLPPFRSY